MPLVAGVDSSTQSTKVELRDSDDGRLVGRGKAPHPQTTPPVSEQDPSAWLGAFHSAWGQALAAAGRDAGDVAALSVAGQQHGCVVLDEAGEVLRPAKLWNDTTTAPDAGWLRKQLPGGDAAWAQACGSVPLAAFTITKLSWLHRSEPDVWARLARVCLPHDWLTLQLTGAFVTDRGDASGTGYWSPAAERYRYDLLAVVDGERDWSTALPEVLGPIDPAGTWQPDASAGAGGREVLVGPGTGDNMAAALGLGVGEGQVAVSIGTSGTVYAVGRSATADPSGAVAGFADATGRFLPLVCTLNAARVTDAVARLLGVDAAGLDELALAAEPGAGGLTLLPYLAGERTPDRPDATGLLAGLRTDVTREQLARAAVEGVACGLLDALDTLGAHADLDDDELLVVGGGAHSPAYRRVLADLSGRAVVTLDGMDEAVATGACVQAAAVLHRRAPEEVRSEWSIGERRVTEPSPGSAASAEEIRATYATLRDR